MNGRRCILKNNCPADFGRHSMKGQNKKNESVMLEMYRNGLLKQLNNDCMKTFATENEYNKLENGQSQMENEVFLASPKKKKKKKRSKSTKQNEIKLNTIRKFSKVTSIDMKERKHLMK